jgi:ATP-dependent exoDNAse (exonuclease V) beta subunit
MDQQLLLNDQRDQRISFLEEPHLYLIDEKLVPGLLSVTTFVHTFFEHFDADLVIEKMMNSKGWVNSKYYGKTADEIKAEWDKIRDEAADAGTKMHLAIEQYYNSQIDPTIPLEQEPKVIDTVEYRHFEKFKKDHEHLVPFKTEWRIFDEDLKLAGSIDMIFKDPNNEGCIYIYDWKRSKEIKFQNWFQKGLAPLEHLDDCNYNHYTLQLNVYRYIIEKNYGLKATELAIVVFHPNNDSYRKIPIKFKDLEIEQVMNHRTRALLP